MAAVRARSAASKQFIERRVSAPGRSSTVFQVARHDWMVAGQRKESIMIQKNWQELIKPNKIEFSSKKKTLTTLVAEPLERGFGITLGNALRRVLLSSLQGAAITQVQIDGVLHEFSSIAGVREDVTDIVLNLKALGLRVHSDMAKRMHLKVEGPSIVTAGMIEVGHDIE